MQRKKICTADNEETYFQGRILELLLVSASIAGLESQHEGPGFNSPLGQVGP